LPSLKDLPFDAGLHADDERRSAPESELARQLDAARLIIGAVERSSSASTAVDPVLSPAFDRIRWFPLPTGS
jgi:hypothetical protein